MPPCVTEQYGFFINHKSKQLNSILYYELGCISVDVKQPEMEGELFYLCFVPYCTLIILAAINPDL